MRIQIFEVPGGERLQPAPGDLLLIERGDDHVTQFIKWSTILAGLSVTKEYVDAQAALRLPVDGSQAMTGPLTLAGAPSEDRHAATKAYVDTGLAGVGGAEDKLDLAGGTMRGELVLYGDPMFPLAAATKQYADARETAARDYADTKLSKSGGQLTGPLVLTGVTPENPDEAVPKSYVDAAVAAAASALPAVGAVAYAADFTADFNGATYQTLTLAGNLVVTGTTNRAAGKSISILLVSDGLERVLGFPEAWSFLGTKPVALAADKVAVLSLTCFGATENEVVAAYATQA